MTYIHVLRKLGAPILPWGNLGIFYVEAEVTIDNTQNHTATSGVTQIHTWGGGGYTQANSDNTLFNLGFSNIVDFSHGHHVRTGGGSDVINFKNLSEVESTIVGRIEDFDYSRDEIQINGVTLDFDNLPNNVKIVEWNGNYNDSGANPQQWILIDTGPGYIFYALEGARVDMNGDGGANDGDQENHFVAASPNLSTLQNVDFLDPQNFVPLGYSVSNGGIIVNDYDHNPADVLEIVSGTSGEDLIAAGLNNDRVEAFSGHDRVWGGSGNDTVLGGDGNDTVSGNMGRDSLLGGLGNDFIYGGRHNDIIFGASGGDNISGGSGSDTIIGGNGRDILSGGSGTGQDIFVFETITESAVGASGRDQINGFMSGQDNLDLHEIDANSATAGNQNFTFNGTAARANSVWFVVSGTDVILRGDVNGNTTADFEIQMNGVSTLVAADFLL